MKQSLKVGTAIRGLVVLLLLAILPLVHAQIAPPGGGGGSTNALPPIPPTYGRSLVDLQIQHIGTIRLELFDREKPASARNFLNYILTGAYSNSFLHSSVSNFVVQGGSLQLLSFSGGSQAIGPVPEAAPVTNELAVGRFFSNVRGTIALAHYDGETNNATCHWFINLADNTWLDAPDTNHAYTVFGRVVSGLDLLDKLNPGSSSNAVSVVDLGGWLTDLPLRQGVTAQTATYSDLLLTTYQIAALDMALQIVPLADGTQRVSWQSVSNKTHTLQFSSALATTWQTLWTTNGDGTRQSMIATNANPARFYRLKYQ